MDIDVMFSPKRGLMLLDDKNCQFGQSLRLDPPQPLLQSSNRNLDERGVLENIRRKKVQNVSFIVIIRSIPVQI